MSFPIEPKAEFFKKPAELTPGYGTTITDEGHIYGYLTLWNVRLIGSGRKNTRPPKSKNDLRSANAYNTKCSDGTIVRTGVIAGDGGHHYKGNFAATQAAYADISTKVANVTYGEDEHGLWFSGALTHRCDEAMAQDIRSSGVSGHWEPTRPGGHKELLGACCVNLAGFNQEAAHRIVASATMTPGGGFTLTPEIEEEQTGEALSIREESARINSPGSRIMAAASLLVPVSGVLAALGTETVDGRVVMDVEWDRLPMPLWYLNEQGSWGHCGAEIVGSLTDIRVEGSLVMFDGMIDAGIEAADGVELVSALGVMGISMDGTVPADVEVEVEYDEYGWPVKVTFPMYKILGATLTPMPAFQETLGVAVGVGAEANAPAAEAVPAEEAATEEAIAASAVATTIKPPIIWR